MTKKEMIEVAKMLGLAVSGKNMNQLKKDIEDKLGAMSLELFIEENKEVNVGKIYKGTHPITGKVIE